MLAMRLREAIFDTSNDNSGALPTDAGHAVHGWASQDDPWIRHAVDLSPLSPAQIDWLLSLSDESRRRLSAAGPYQCSRAVEGVRLNDGLPAFGWPEPQAARPWWRRLLPFG